MSVHSISIVPKKSSYPDNAKKAQEILNWLISKDIVKPTLSDCILSSSKRGYAISNGASQITLFPINIWNTNPNGLEIITKRQVFDTGGNWIDELICPACTKNITFNDCDLSPWEKNQSDDLICLRCGHQTEINNFIFRPDWGFSNLGFTFWNWPYFTNDFIEDFKRKLKCDVSIVDQHI